MADLIELIFAEDNETLLRKDTGEEVDAKPFDVPRVVRSTTRQPKIDKNCDWSGNKITQENAYSLGESYKDGGLYFIAVQFYKIPEIK